MRYLPFSGIILCLAGAALGAQAAPAPIVLTHATVIDGVAAEPLRDVTIVIVGGRIERIATGAVPAPAGATVLDLRGRWVVPGLIDAHAHIRDLPAARAVLASGVTTARSLGVDHFSDIGIRDLHRHGVADVPDVLAAGYHVRPHPSAAMFLDLPFLAGLMGGVTGHADVRRMVRAQVARGVDVIKIMATERAGLPETDPRKRVYGAAELEAAVQEARAGGRPVAAHAHGDEGAAAAVRAGAATIEHGTWLSDATIALMKERGTCLVPTIATVIDMSDTGGDYDHPALATRGRAMLPAVRDATRRAHAAGVRVISGTDTFYGPQSTRRIADEVAELVATGMTPLEGIASATSVAAACLGIDRRTGAVRTGLEADLVALARDPRADIRALREVVLVMNDGRVVTDRLREP